MNKEVQYTIISNDENDYSTIHTCLEAPNAYLTKLTITGLTTLCTIVVLDKKDFIEINETKYFINDDYTDLNSTSLAEILTQLLDIENIDVEVNNSNRLDFTCDNGSFQITNASYGMKQITGMYSAEFPIKSDEEGNLSIKSTGFYLSTPILYLLSNLGASVYQNRARKYSDQKIAMRINNSFMANYPIVCNNVEFSPVVISNSLSDVWFKLVDANLQPIKLLSPLYISATGFGMHAYGWELIESDIENAQQ